MSVECSLLSFILYSLGVAVQGVALGFALLGNAGTLWGMTLAAGLMLVMGSLVT